MLAIRFFPTFLSTMPDVFSTVPDVFKNVEGAAHFADYGSAGMLETASSYS